MGNRQVVLPGPKSFQTHGGETAESTPLVEVRGLGVKFTIGRRREDVQSLAYRALLKRKKQEEFWALMSVDFRGAAGEILGIVGGNGAGKSTLCRVLAGVLVADTGSVRIHGKTSALLSLGTGFNAELTGRENVFLNGLMLGLSKQDVRNLLPSIVDFSGLGRFVDQPLKHYSSGMKARLGFSIASMVEPEILILDETLSVGDLEFVAKAGDRMQTLIARARLVIVVTHSLRFVKQFCTTAMWLDRGVIRTRGYPDDVVAQYREAIPKRSAVVTAPGVSRRAAQPKSQPVIARNLGVRYRLRGARTDGTLWALRDVGFAINEGETLGVIGPNGAGKTTLCKVLSGILKPDQGDVAVAGKITALLTLGAGFNGELTGRDNILLNGLMLGMPKNRVRDVYPDIVAFSGLAQFIEEPVKHYSGGMRARLAFSIGAMLEPDVLIIDEVLNAGDAAFHQRATAKIRELMTRAKAVVLATHSLAFVEAVCTRAIWLDHGMVRLDGTPTEAVSAYRSSRKPVGQPGSADR